MLNKPMHTETFIADTESLADYQYHFVKMDGNKTVCKMAADTDTPIGILQNNPARYAEAIVTVIGRSKITGGEDCTFGTVIGSGADGRAEVANAANQFAAGQMVKRASGDGVLGECVIDCTSLNVNP